jgi:sugar phosphate isomerase/epimerase
MKLGLFSVSYAGFWGQQKLEVPAFIAKAAELGYDAIMLAGKRPHLSPLDARPDRIASIKASLEQHKIACGVVAGYTDLAPPRAAEVPFLEMQIAYVESLARVAAALGASVVRVFSAYEVDGCSPHAIWDGAVKALREMCDRAVPHGVTIAVQNHHDLGVHSDVLLELLTDVDRPNCKAGFDAWSPALCGENLYDAARKMAPHAVMTTNADYVRLPRFHYQPDLVSYRRAEPDFVRAVTFGEGFIDYEAFFQGLRDGGFDGFANYEMCSPIRGGGTLENLDASAARYVQWMHEHALT